MGDSGLTTTLAVIAMSAIAAAFILATVAWRVRRRMLRITIGLGMLVLGLLCAIVSLAGFVLIEGMGAAIVVLGIRTRETDRPPRKANN